MKKIISRMLIITFIVIIIISATASKGGKTSREPRAPRNTTKEKKEKLPQFDYVHVFVNETGYTVAHIWCVPAEGFTIVKRLDPGLNHARDHLIHPNNKHYEILQQCASVKARQEAGGPTQNSGPAIGRVQLQEVK